MHKVADLHCDLLSYLAGDAKRSIYDSAVRCSLPQFIKGNVFFQALAVYSETGKNSVSFAEKQFSIFSQLEINHPDTLQRVNNFKKLQPSDKVQVAVAIENASGLCDENEALQVGLKRFDFYQKQAGPILYISLTWNHENRFGGGNLSTIGLKPDGEYLLEHLNGKGVAIDLSHTSDALAYDILDYIDKKKLAISLIASHSNFRALCDQPRNLPDPLAQEIIKRGGLIGMNFFKPFVGTEGPLDFKRHVAHGRSLSEKCDHLCFGADFFYDKDLISFFMPPFYHENFESAECYPHMLSCLEEVCNPLELEKIAQKNVTSFLEKL